MTPKSTEAVRKHREKLRTHGYVIVSTWVPAEVSKRLDKVAREAGMSRSRAVSAILQAVMRDHEEA